MLVGILSDGCISCYEGVSVQCNEGGLCWCGNHRMVADLSFECATIKLLQCRFQGLQGRRCEQRGPMMCAGGIELHKLQW